MKDARSTRDAGASGNRKESLSSSSSGKKQRASSSRGSRVAVIRSTPSHHLLSQ